MFFNNCIQCNTRFFGRHLSEVLIGQLVYLVPKLLLVAAEHKASHAENKRYLRWLYPYLGGKYLDEITRDVMDEITRARKAEGVSNATVNRTIQGARAILRRAALEWEWIDRAPRIRFLPEQTTGTILDQGGGRASASSPTGAFGGNGTLYFGDRSAGGQCGETRVESDKPYRATRLDSPGSGQGSETDRRALE